MTNMLTAALDLAAAGYSCIPIRTDGSKAPALGSWKRYTTERANENQLRAWFEVPDPPDLGVVQGTVSGNAELTELEGRAAHHLPDLKTLAHDTGLGDLWALITQGWVEMSPSGGFHFHYRVDSDIPGNTKLARDAGGLVLAETRGEGGQVVVAPSRHHPTGRPWQRLTGGPTSTPLLTTGQRDAFHALLRTLDHQPDTRPTTAALALPHDPTAGITPGDDYENRVDWADILTPHGWTLIFQRGRTRYWLRPGKERGTGISATTGHSDDRDRLYVFTSSTDFTPEVPYTKLGALAVLEFGGDMSAAAKTLYATGYGQRAEEARPTADDLAGLIAPSTPTPAAPPTGSAETSPTTHTAPQADPVTYTETDDGNALRLIDTHQATIRFVPQRGQWLTWDGHRWTWDEAGHVQELARTIARGLRSGDKTAQRHRQASLSRRGLDAMVTIARTDPRTVTHLADLDARPFELNTPAGVVDLRTAMITTPDPAALHTRSTTVAPDAATTPVRWLRFLADTFAGDPDLTNYVQRLLGLSLVGQVLEQALPFAHGSGANGKTTLLGAVQRIVGIGDHGYSISAPAEMLLATHQQGHPTEIARLAGARLVVTSELEDGQRFAEARIKQLTGRDVISGRFMRQDWFSFTPTHTLWLLANHQPAVRAGGPAFWRRLRLLPFEHTVPPEKRVADLEDRLVEDEGPAILAWLIAGAASYFRDGLVIPHSVQAATAAYETDTDTLGRFVNEQCTTGDPGAQHLQVRVTELRAAYETWCRVEGEEPVSAKALTQGLRARFGVLSARTANTRFYSGIRLTDASGEPSDASSAGARWFQDAAL